MLLPMIVVVYQSWHHALYESQCKTVTQTIACMLEKNQAGTKKSNSFLLESTKSTSKNYFFSTDLQRARNTTPRDVNRSDRRLAMSRKYDIKLQFCTVVRQADRNLTVRMLMKHAGLLQCTFAA
jgi:hypothetical protein